MQKDNHYVSQGYLKRFCNDEKQLWVYRTLVPDSRVPHWKPATPKGVAKREHLFTRFLGGQETDDIERWMSSEFESPAEAAIERAVSNKPLKRKDWDCLIRFFALHAVRSPRRLFERFTEWPKQLPDLINDTVQRLPARLEAMIANGQKIEPPPTSMPFADEFPCRITTELRPGEEKGTLKAEVLSGRLLWHWEMRRQLTETWKVMQRHRWTILIAPENLPWFTSDAPSVALNYYGPHAIPKYDFGGRWGRKGSELFMPLSPTHLLFTQVGHKQIPRDTVAPENLARQIRRFLAEHADRMVFASTCDREIRFLRPRIANKDQYDFEEAEWKRWNAHQTEAEREFLSKGQVIRHRD